MRRVLVITLAVLALGLGGCSSAFGLKGDKVREQSSEQGDPDSTGADSATQDADAGGGSSTDVPDAEGSGSDSDGAGGATGTEDPLLAGFEQGVPADWPSDVPVPDGAADVVASSGAGLPIPGAEGKAIVMTLPGSQEEVARTYSEALAAAGWGDSPLLSMFGGTTEGAIVKSKGDRTILAMPTQTNEGTTQLMVMVINGDLATLLQQGPDHAPVS